MNRESFLKFVTNSKQKDVNSEIISLLKFRGIESDIINAISEKILIPDLNLSDNQIMTIIHNQLNQYVDQKICNMELNECETNFIILCGINGSGKTTTSFKMLHFLDKIGKNAHLVNCDIIRDGAVFQFDGINHAVENKFSTSYNVDRIDMNDFIDNQVDFILKNKFNIAIFDTPGFIVGNIDTLEYIGKIFRQLKMLKSSKISISVIFVADVNIGRNILMQTEFLSNSIKIDHIIVSKFDINPNQIGYILQIANNMNVKISGIADGVNFDDIHAVKKSDIVSAILSFDDIKNIKSSISE